MGIMTESKTSGALKLQTMVDKRVKCIAKNYSVDEQTKAGINQTDKQMTQMFNAPNDPVNPVFINKLGPNKKQGAMSFESSDDSDDQMSQLNKRTASQLQKMPGEKRVSMHSSQLRKALIDLFQQRDEFRLNEMVDMLDHPVQPLKAALKDLADYDKSARVYRLKANLRF